MGFFSDLGSAISSAWSSLAPVLEKIVVVCKTLVPVIAKICSMIPVPQLQAVAKILNIVGPILHVIPTGSNMEEIGDSKKAYVSSLFNEEHDYFTMHYKKSNTGVVICS